MNYPPGEERKSVFWAFLFLLLFAAVIAVSGCAQSQTREKTATDKVDKISISGTLTIPTPEGPRPVPIALTIDRRGYEDQSKESDTRTSVDGAAIGREIAAVLGPVLAAGTGGGFSWSGILAGAGAAATAATTGYLALKKREQLRPTRK